VDKAVLDHRGLGVHALGEAILGLRERQSTGAKPEDRLTRQALPLATPRAHNLVL